MSSSKGLSWASRLLPDRLARQQAPNRTGPLDLLHLADPLEHDLLRRNHLARLVAALGEACPEGIDVFFDNAGGDVLDAALANLALRARIALCGSISQYNTDTPKGPANYLKLVIMRASMAGFVVMDYLPRAPEAMAEIVP